MAALAPFAFHPSRQVPDEWLKWLAAALQSSSAVAPPPPHDPEAVLPVLAAQGLLPLLYVRLRNGPAWVKSPAPFRDALAAAFQANAARTFLLDQQLARIGAQLGPCIRLGLLKGAALGRVAYDSAAERPVSDLDLLVAPHDVEKAAGGMAALGFTARGLTARGGLGAWQRKYRAELPFTSDILGLDRLLVELHWSLVELPYYIARIDPQALWRHASRAPDLPTMVIPHAAILLLHTCAHLGLHHSTDLRLIWLVDVYQLVQHVSMDWNAFLERVREWRLGKPAYETLRAARSWLGAEVPPEVIDETRRLGADPISSKHWGLGDEQPGRAGRRAGISLATLPLAAKGSYLAWLALRTLGRPWEQRASGRNSR